MGESGKGRKEWVKVGRSYIFFKVWEGAGRSGKK